MDYAVLLIWKKSILLHNQCEALQGGINFPKFPNYIKHVIEACARVLYITMFNENVTLPTPRIECLMSVLS